jgi:hypothetical protein
MLEFPAEWRPGQLLHTQRYTDGAIKFTLLKDQDKRDAQGVYFDNSVDAQNFIAWWYQGATRVEDGRYGSAQKALSPGRGEGEDKNDSVNQPLDAARKRQAIDGKIAGHGRTGSAQENSTRPILHRRNAQR